MTYIDIKKHMNKRPMTLVIRDIESKIRYHDNLVDCLKLKRFVTPSLGEDCSNS